MTFDPTDFDHAKGPGKYEGNETRSAGAYIHELSLNGGTEECGSIEYGSGHYVLMYLNPVEQGRCIDLGWTPDVDADPTSSPVAAIVHEDDRGFVNVTFYDSEEAAQATFGEAQGEYDMLDAYDGDDPEVGPWLT